ncbi:malonyl-CoA decarboxylase [Alkalilimnicola ehrlichii]|uniref:Malonyl-CoA decarboxylase n=1 Tax=Alkalilimnicola ehrlichii TaxID=351052 RepID=A0A3E0WUU8_9GAMM|nr:malonyl-CoA decarboxylase [Alkalilimnicola ehrlichii]RFA28590.1 malonyl-CoA decarboxylase [Alkalilimnicola ehrlichii]RFA35755.1 malonyl-CoA decarboxylase [Alkalilimnicola ehrlichii]
MGNQPASIIERAFRRLIPGGREAVTGRYASNHVLSVREDLPESDLEIVKQWIDDCLAENGGQVAARNRAAMLGMAYLQLSEVGRVRFLGLLAEQYGVAEHQVEASIEAWRRASGTPRVTAAAALRKVLEPPRTRLLRQFNGVPAGVKFLVDMRAEILGLRKEHPSLEPLAAELQDLLATWFDVGLLQLEEISWSSSAALLEKLIAYEAVHAIKSWSDLKNRLDSDRRCFAFFHPNMPDEPLIFVEVALVNGLASNVQKLLDEDAPTQDIDLADTAIFYSISNAQKGLSGISFGNFLIKQVVKKLQEEFPRLKQFATLSPIPGFCRWLAGISAKELSELPGGPEWLNMPPPRSAERLAEEGADAAQADVLTRLAATYLCLAKRSNDKALDPVAHFHLSNGAQVTRINWLADTSEKGFKQSAGMMVNYLYEIPKIEQRSNRYLTTGAVAKSAVIKRLLK